MSKKTISLRLDEDNLQMIKLFCELNGNTVSDYIQTLVENDLSFSVGLKRSKLFIGKGCLFYPCFLTNDHLHELGILFNQKFGNHGNKTLIKVRKGMLNLGLDFEIGCYNQIEGKDAKSEAVLKQMLEDEQRHADKALASGGIEFPEPAKNVMTFISKVMTKTTYHL